MGTILLHFENNMLFLPWYILVKLKILVVFIKISFKVIFLKYSCLEGILRRH